MTSHDLSQIAIWQQYGFPHEKTIISKTYPPEAKISILKKCYKYFFLNEYEIKYKVLSGILYIKVLLIKC